ERGGGKTALDNIGKTVEGKTRGVALARTLLFLALGDRGALETLAKTSPFPEVTAAATAALAELAGDAKAAADGWQHALATDGFGRAHLTLALHVARAKLALGDAAGARAACASILHPTLFHWSWGAALGECRQLSAARTPP